MFFLQAGADKADVPAGITVILSPVPKEVQTAALLKALKENNIDPKFITLRDGKAYVELKNNNAPASTSIQIGSHTVRLATSLGFSSFTHHKSSSDEFATLCA